MHYVWLWLQVKKKEEDTAYCVNILNRGMISFYEHGVLCYPIAIIHGACWEFRTLDHTYSLALLPSSFFFLFLSAIEKGYIHLRNHGDSVMIWWKHLKSLSFSGFAICSLNSEQLGGKIGLADQDLELHCSIFQGENCKNKSILLQDSDQSSSWI